MEAGLAPGVKIFGVGNAGAVLLNALAAPEFAAAQTALINTDAGGFAASSAAIKIHLESKLLRALGSGGDPDRARASAEEQFSTLKTVCAGADVVFILAGLGGGAGSGISPVLAKAAREAGALVLAFVTLPFDCEGNRRAAQAQAALAQLKAMADGVVCLPSQKLFRLIDENTGVIETFAQADRLLIEGVRGVWHLLTRPGQIQVHFGELCALLRERHEESAFAFVETTGPARAREAVEKIIAHPLFDEGRALVEAGMVLVSLLAGQQLTMAEMNLVIQQVQRQCGRAQVIVGATVDAALREKLCVTVLAARPAEAAPAGAARGGVRALPSAEPPRLARGGIHPGVGGGRRGTKALIQTQLSLNIVSKTRFDKSDPTLHQGENLDVPTFMRRGIPLN